MASSCSPAIIDPSPPKTPLMNSNNGPLLGSNDFESGHGAAGLHSRGLATQDDAAAGRADLTERKHEGETAGRQWAESNEGRRRLSWSSRLERDNFAAWG